QQIGVDYGQGSMSLNTYENTYSGTPTYDITALCASNPLYSPDCEGYAAAYAAWLYQQQCIANPLYDSGCPGYATAYYNQQCSLDPLYDSGCTGYAEAYYEQLCSLDPLYDSGCDGYEQAYYETYVAPGLEEQIADASGTSDDVTTTNTTQTGGVEVTATGVRDPVQSATNVSQTGDSTVDEILRNNNDTTDTVVVDITPVESPRVETTETTTQTETREEREEPEQELTVASIEREVDDERETEPSSDVDEQLDSTGDNEGSDAGQESDSETETSSEGGSESSESSGAGSGEKKESRKEKIKKMVAEKAKNLANDMATAATIEDQQKIQAQVLALIGFNPDFGTYAQNIIPQTAFYQDTQMPDTTIPNSKRGLRNGLAQQLLHEKMVEMQYNR
ncbi:MAG: hypothetical protein VW270_20420, partial [Candidatus Poseidoniales archaeon]